MATATFYGNHERSPDPRDGPSELWLVQEGEWTFRVVTTRRDDLLWYVLYADDSETPFDEPLLDPDAFLASATAFEPEHGAEAVERFVVSSLQLRRELEHEVQVEPLPPLDSGDPWEGIGL